MLDTATAEHEAAHVVVGCALGLKLKRASIAHAQPGHDSSEGFTWFQHGRDYLAFGVMVCAGIAWESRPGGEPAYAAADLKSARQIHRYRANVETSVRIAREMLDGRRRLHARIASELCDRDLGSADIERLIIDPS